MVVEDMHLSTGRAGAGAVLGAVAGYNSENDTGAGLEVELGAVDELEPKELHSY